VNGYLFVALVLAVGPASAARHFVPPPAPQIVEGTPITVEREILGPDQVIHLARSVPADVHQLVGSYMVGLECSGVHPLKAQLSPRTSPFGSVNEELLFLSLPDGQDEACLLTVLDRSTYPWKQVFHGAIGSIPKIAD
jgi:hypothetical protein